VDESDSPALSLTEWLVLGLVAEGATHGFAIAAILGPGGQLGHVWHIRRPLVYRALQRLRDLELVSAAGVEPTSHGPARTLVRVTAAGDAAARRWLTRPVGHVRDVRSELMVKLALLDRSGADASGLLAAQRAVVEPIVAALRDRVDAARGFDRTLAGWRYEMAAATLAFLDQVQADTR
jgi:DNA-binding PadR family transcriptional regulator